jgi:phage gp29-like protein
MLWFKRKNKNKTTQSTQAEPGDRDGTNMVADLTPERVAAIMRAANAGDPRRQSQLANELREANGDISHALQTRENAILGLAWQVRDSHGKANDELAEVLRAAGVEDLITSLAGAILPGFSVAEILWGPGGSLAGFAQIPQRHFHFLHASGTADIYRPLLEVSNVGQPIELEADRFLVHTHYPNSGDPSRGGLIRPLAWLHCFARTGLANWMAFVERYGMPFVVAKLEDEAWQNDRNLIKRVIRNFGPSGGGVFSRNVELELLEAAKTDGQGYVALLEYIESAITKVILGQTATSGDGGGWSLDSAQGQVRQDILEADCRAIEKSLNTLLRSYRTFNGGEEMLFKLECEPPEDTKALAELVKTLYDAGLQADEKEISARLGLTLTRAAAPATAPVEQQTEDKPEAALTALSAAAEQPSLTELLKQHLVQGDLYADFAEHLASTADRDFVALMHSLQDDPDQFYTWFGEDSQRVAQLLATETLSAVLAAAREVTHG